MTEGPAVRVVAAVVRREGRYLVCLRPPGKRHGGLWEFPGGKVLGGETLEDAVRRELAEELDLSTRRLGEVLFTAADDGTPFLIDFVETWADGTPTLHEHTELGWFTVDELTALRLAPADARFVETLAGPPRPSP